MKKNHSFTALCPKYALNLKLPLVMRISLALLFAVVLQLSAEDGYAQRTRVAISMNNVSVEQVLNKIEETSDYVFLYNDKTIQVRSWIFLMRYLKEPTLLIQWLISRLSCLPIN